MLPALAPQRMEVRRAVVTGNHRLAVDQEQVQASIGQRCCRLDRTKSGDQVTLTAVDSAPGQAPSPRVPKAIFKMPLEDQMRCPTLPRTG